MVAGRAHLVELLLDRCNDLVVAGQREGGGLVVALAEFAQ